MNYTDEQIIKAFDSCFNRGFSELECDKCPFYTATTKCTEDLRQEVIDLIKRLKAENEKLNSLCTSKDVIINDLNAKNAEYKSEHKGFVKKLGDVASLHTLLFDRKNELESEARRGFAERLKDKASLIHLNAFDCAYKITEDDIDNLLEEMEKENVV